jgi:hypothetical protein
MIWFLCAVYAALLFVPWLPILWREYGWRWHRKLRRETGEVYMDRWQLFKTRWLCIYVNRINMPDYDDMPHNHPWPRAYSLKLRRSYREETFERWPHSGLVSNGIPSIHRITEVDEGGAWTLFIGFNRRPGSDKAWGFIRPDGSVVPADERKVQRGVSSEV